MLYTTFGSASRSASAMHLLAHFGVCTEWIVLLDVKLEASLGAQFEGHPADPQHPRTYYCDPLGRSGLRLWPGRQPRQLAAAPADQAYPRTPSALHSPGLARSSASRWRIVPP